MVSELAVVLGAVLSLGAKLGENHPNLTVRHIAVGEGPKGFFEVALRLLIVGIKLSAHFCSPSHTSL